MRTIFCSLLLCMAVGAAAQTINPSQIRPGSNGQSLQTIGGVTAWGSGGGGSGSPGGATNSFQFNAGSGTFGGLSGGLGSIPYFGASGVPTTLLGPTSADVWCLTSQGTGLHALAPQWTSPCPGSGGGTPGGSSGAIQYNNGGAFGGNLLNGFLRSNNTGAPTVAPSVSYSPNNTIFCAGDSLCANNTNPYYLAYPYLVAADLGITPGFTQVAVNGAQIADAVKQLYTANYNPSLQTYALTSLNAVTNDINVKGPGTYQTGVFIPSYYAALAKMGLTSEYWALGTAATVTGTTHYETANNFNACFTDASGSTCAFPLTVLQTSGPVFILQRAIDGNTGTGTYSIVSTGGGSPVATGTITTQTTPAIATQNGLTSSVIMATPIQNIPAGNYVVTFTQTSSGANGMGIAAVGSPPVGGSVRLPPVVAELAFWQEQGVSTTFAAGYVEQCNGDNTQSGTVFNNASDPVNCDPYRANQKTVIAAMQGYGLDIRMNDPRAGVPGCLNNDCVTNRGVVNPKQAPYFADTLHRSNFGNQVAEKQEEEQLNASTIAAFTQNPVDVQHLTGLSPTNANTHLTAVSAGVNLLNDGTNLAGDAIFYTTNLPSNAGSVTGPLIFEAEYFKGAPFAGKYGGCAAGSGALTFVAGFIDPVNGFKYCTHYEPKDAKSDINGSFQMQTSDFSHQYITMPATPSAGYTGYEYPMTTGPNNISGRGGVFNHFTSGVLDQLGFVVGPSTIYPFAVKVPTGEVTISSSLTLSAITGATQCLQASSAGAVSGTGIACGTVLTTGTPSSGQMAKFSGSNTLTNAVANTDYLPVASPRFSSNLTNSSSARSATVSVYHDGTNYTLPMFSFNGEGADGSTADLTNGIGMYLIHSGPAGSGGHQFGIIDSETSNGMRFLANSSNFYFDTYIYGTTTKIPMEIGSQVTFDAGQVGPASAPSGSCTGQNGTWVFSQDGHATFCASGTWVTKI